MKTKIRFQKVRLEELQALLPEAALDGHDRRNSDGANAPKTVKKRAAKPEAALDGHKRRNSDGANALKTVKKRAAKPANQKAKR